MVRYPRGGGAGRIILWDRGSTLGRGCRMEHGFTRSLMGPYFDAAHPGSLWSRTMSEDDPSPDLVDFHSARQLREMVIIPLESNARFIDTLELHFPYRLRNFQQLILNSLAPVLARTWQKRAQGLFTEALLKHSRSAPERISTPILSDENPARLSRAEYRVCLMLSRGMSVDQVKEELRIRESTLRSHLSNLYAKTRSASLSELIYRLMAAPPQAVVPLRPTGTS
ncbi:MAG: LuxR C-terminal-related transcriptional regulator [Paracoccaceae bacterium]